ncbi:hypothetical protein [Streptomyces sp. NPDC093149]|uniref:hypothetical protein n=1 Tax=Streptomyces sp. NPDC093149 TaxID=3366031 RepID=UPI003821AF36
MVGEGWCTLDAGSIFPAGGHICPDKDLVASHWPRRLELPSGRWSVACPCGWFPVPQRWHRLLAALWEQHILTEAGALPAAPPVIDPEHGLPLAEHTEESLAELYNRLWDVGVLAYVQSPVRMNGQSSASSIVGLGRFRDTAGCDNLAVSEELSRWYRSRLVVGPFRPFDVCELEELEREIGLPLPSSCRSFLEAGGGEGLAYSVCLPACEPERVQSFDDLYQLGRDDDDESCARSDPR